MATILLLDNYDSFTFNLFQLLRQLGAEVTVIRNDKITPAGVAEIKPAGIVISPGPGRPETAGHSTAIIERCGPSTPILGVCLGHQCIGAVYGATIISAPELMHGKTAPVFHNRQGIFADLESPVEVIRYHSLTIDPATLPDTLEVTGQTENGTIMGIRHRAFDVEGVQFHPESILTTAGPRMLTTWLSRIT